MVSGFTSTLKVGFVHLNVLKLLKVEFIFVALHRKDFFSYLIKKNSPYGWLSPFCEWYPCDYTHHQDIAEDYLGYDEHELEKRGWVKVFKEFDSDKAVYSQYEANEKQLEWLGNHQVHYSKYACMQ